MPYWNECPRCGAKLDPGERCDCQETPAGRVVTMEDWNAAGSLEKCMEPGDLVEESIVDAIVNDLPPATLTRDLVQGGEPYSHAVDPRTERWRPTFLTFSRDAGQWTFRGYCFRGETVEPLEVKQRRESGRI